LKAKKDEDHKISRVDSTSVRATLRIYWSYFTKDKRHSYPGLLSTEAAHILRYVIAPFMIALILQAVVAQEPTQAFWYVGGLALTLLGATVTNQIGQTYMMRHEERVQTELVELCTENLMHQSYSFFTDRKVGALSNDVMGFTRGYVLLIDQYMYHTSSLIIALIGGLIVVSFVAPLLLLPLAFAAILLILTNIHNVRARAVYRNKRKRLTSAFVGELSDVIGNQILARIFARENHEVKKLVTKRHHIHALANKEIDVILNETIYRSATIFGIQVLVFAAIVWLVASGNLAIAGALFSAQYMLRVSESMFQISGVIRGYEQIFLDAANMTELLEYKVDVVDVPDAPDIKISKGEIVLNTVNYSYSAKQNEEAVFQNLSLTIPAGQRVGLAGHSGGGKTTLTKLLLRFMDISSGEILIDSQNIARVSQTSLRDCVAYVPQEPYLFHRSLRDNIAYGSVDSNDDDIMAAAKKAHAWEFIEKLPNGLDTIVGERGIKLSGGQRQRIAIARAILKDAPILVLDEATSALDSESEKLIQASLDELMKGRTSIVIAHRLSTIAKLDRIIVLDNGKIVEDGTHTELQKAGGVYASLWSHQSDGFIDD